MLDSRQAESRAAVWSSAVLGAAMTWNLLQGVGIPRFRFAREYDVGMTVYLVLVSVWFFAALPVAALSPMFFADPAGAVVGKYLTRNGFTNPAWYQKKTVGGSLAVFIFLVITLALF